MRQRWGNYANLIDFNEDDQEYFDQEPVEVDPLDDIKARLMHLSRDAKAKLADELDLNEDFPSAWLEQP